MYCLVLPCMYGHVIAIYSHVINAINGNTSINMTTLGYTVHGNSWIYMAIHGNKYMAVHVNTELNMASMAIYGNTWQYAAIHG